MESSSNIFKEKSVWVQSGLFKDEIREKILHRCEILKYMGDDGIPSNFDQLNDIELYYDCFWVLDEEHDDLDNFQFSVTRKIVNDASARSAKDMWS